MKGNVVQDERKLVEVFPGVSSDVSVKFPIFGQKENGSATSSVCCPGGILRFVTARPWAVAPKHFYLEGQ